MPAVQGELFKVSAVQRELFDSCPRRIIQSVAGFEANKFLTGAFMKEKKMWRMIVFFYNNVVPLFFTILD